MLGLDLLILGGHLLFSLAAFLLLTEDVRLKQLVLTLDLFVVLFHGFKALHELIDAE